MNNQPIGILDSGVGGLTIWKEIVKLLPQESTIYLADSKNCPYGNKPPEEIYQLAYRLISFLIAKQVKLIVIACNTITVHAITKLRTQFPQIPLVGTVPVVKKAVDVSQKKKIGILSTVATAKSDYQKQLIEAFAKDCQVITVGTDLLVPFVERGEVPPKETLQKELQAFTDAGVDVIALGCSHFPFLKSAMQEIVGKNVLFLDSAAAIARQVERVLRQNNSVTHALAGSHTFYTTGEVEQLAKIVKRVSGGILTGSVTHVTI